HADRAGVRDDRGWNQAVTHDNRFRGGTEAAGRQVDEYLEIAERVVQLARRGGADAADAVLDSGVEFSVAGRQGEIDKLVGAASGGLGLRVFRGGRCAISYTSDLDAAALGRFVEHALDLATVADPDPIAGLPDPDAWALPQPRDLASYDP